MGGHAGRRHGGMAAFGTAEAQLGPEQGGDAPAFQEQQQRNAEEPAAGPEQVNVSGVALNIFWGLLKVLVANHFCWLFWPPGRRRRTGASVKC